MGTEGRPGEGLAVSQAGQERAVWASTRQLGQDGDTLTWPVSVQGSSTGEERSLSDYGDQWS